MTLAARSARLDRAVTQRLQPTRSSRLLGALTALVSVVGDGALLALLLRRTARAPSTDRQLRLLGGVLLAEQAVAGALKHSVRRDRPGDDARPPLALHPDGPGFPSGHTSSGFYAAAALADRSSAPLLYASAAVVALARLHQGVHRASDLLAGALVGTVGGGIARHAGRGASGGAGSPAGSS